MSADAYRILRSLAAHEETTNELIVFGLAAGMIPTCECPNHTFLRELQAQAVADRN